MQFQQRPIPNFYKIAGQSANIDYIVKNGDKIHLSEGLQIEVITTPGHSADEVSYRIGDKVFIGDALPVRGDIPIFINLNDTKHSLEILGKLSGVETFYPAWDKTYSLEMMRNKLTDAKEIINELENIIYELDDEMALDALVGLVCDRLNMPEWKKNPLFAKTIECCRRRK